MLKVLSSILCDLDPKVKVIGQKAGICDGLPSTSALVLIGLLEQYTKFKSKTFKLTFIFAMVTKNGHQNGLKNGKANI